MPQSSQPRDYKGMACLQKAAAGRRDCNGDPHLSKGSGRKSREHEVNRKAPGYDNIYPKFLKSLRTRARKWLAIFLARIISEKNMYTR